MINSCQYITDDRSIGVWFIVLVHVNLVTVAWMDVVTSNMFVIQTKVLLPTCDSKSHYDM